jgi:hypothetical protein
VHLNVTVRTKILNLFIQYTVFVGAGAWHADMGRVVQLTTQQLRREIGGALTERYFYLSKDNAGRGATCDVKGVKFDEGLLGGLTGMGDGKEQPTRHSDLK